MVKRKRSFGAAITAAFGMLLSTVGVVLADTYSSDVTTAAAAISSGDNGSNVKGNAFDDDTVTFWGSSGTAAQCLTVPHYIGQDFGASNSYEIRRFFLLQNTTTLGVSSVDVKYSDDGSSYSSAEIVAITNDGVNHSYDIAAHGSHRYWKLVCNSLPSGGAWRVNEIEMMYILTATATSTLTPTLTLTPSTTPSPTPDYNIAITSTSGAPMRLERSATYGDLVTFGGLMTVAVIGILAFGYWYFRGRIRA